MAKIAYDRFQFKESLKMDSLSSNTISFISGHISILWGAWVKVHNTKKNHKPCLEKKSFSNPGLVRFASPAVSDCIIDKKNKKIISLSNPGLVRFASPAVSDCIIDKKKKKLYHCQIQVL